MHNHNYNHSVDVSSCIDNIDGVTFNNNNYSHMSHHIYMVDAYKLNLCSIVFHSMQGDNIFPTLPSELARSNFYCELAIQDRYNLTAD